MEKRKATGFGKELRKLRIDREETQVDMARRLGVSQSFLSLIEIGEHDAPLGMAARVREEYGLGDEEAARLEEAQSRSAARLMVRLEGATACQREAAALFGNGFRELTDAQCEAIKAALQK